MLASLKVPIGKCRFLLAALASMGKGKAKKADAPERLHSAATLYRGASYLDNTAVKSEASASLADQLKDVHALAFMQTC